MMAVADWLQEMAAAYPAALNKIREGDQSAAVTLPMLSSLVVLATAARDEKRIEDLIRFGWPQFKARLPLSAGPYGTLATWCAANNAECREVESAARIELPPASSRGRFFDYLAEPAYFATLPDAVWVPAWDFVVAGDGTILTDTGYRKIDITYMNCLHFPAESGAAYYRPKREIVLPEAIYLAAPHKNVGHWFVDFLPRLIARTYKPGVPVIVPARMNPKQTESLLLFGIQEHEIIACDPDTTYRINKLHIYKPGQSMPPRPEHVRFVRQNLSRHADKPRSGKRIHMARTSVGTRSIANAGEFQQFLTREGFISLDPADLSIAEQQRLFADAETILGTFGSNMLSLYMAPPGCRVIVMMNDPDEDMCLAPTAAILGMHHQFFLCDASADPGRQRFKKDTDVIVDCAALKERLTG